MPTQRQKLITNLNNFYQKPIAKVSIELFLSVGTVLFFAVFAIRPTLVTMSDLIKEIDDKKKLDQQLTQKIAALSTAQSNYLRYQDQLYVLDEALPNQPNTVETAKILEKVASERFLLINSITVKDIPQNEDPTQIKLSEYERLSYPVSITLTGDYPSIRQFVEDLLALRRSLVVDTVLFKTSEQRGVKQLQATVTISVPYFGKEIKANSQKAK